MPCRLGSTPVEKVDQATGDIDGFDVSSGRNTPCSASRWKFGQPALAHQLHREARVHAVEAEHDHDARRERVLVRVADADRAVDEREGPRQQGEGDERQRADQHHRGADEGEAGAGADVSVRAPGKQAGDRGRQGEARDQGEAFAGPGGTRGARITGHRRIPRGL